MLDFKDEIEVQGRKEGRKNGYIETLADAMRALKNIKNSNWNGT